MTSIGGNYNAIADVSGKFQKPSVVKANDGQVDLGGTNATAVIADLESEITSHDKVVVHQGGKAVEISKEEAQKLLADLKGHKVDLSAVKLEVNEEGIMAYAEHLAHELGHMVEHGAHMAHYPHMAAEFIELCAGHERMEQIMGKLGNQAFGKAMAGVGIVIGGAQAIEYGEKFMHSMESGDGDAAYNAMQALLGAGSGIPGPLGWSCAAVSDMLKTKEGKGAFKEYVVDTVAKYADQYNMNTVASKEQMSWAVDGIVNDGDGSHDKGSGSLVKDKGGFQSEADALAHIKAERDGTYTGQIDYAIAKEADGSFTVYKIESENALIADDISNQFELESINLKGNKHHIVGIVAEDGSYGKAKERSFEDGSKTWDVVYQKDIDD
ncbi:MAG: hypothetical protein ACAI44_03990 [Candidatus Sericytochromatia bacterium]